MSYSKAVLCLLSDINNFYISFLCLIFGIPFGFGQTITIIDQRTNAPIPEVSVYTKNSKAKFSDALGTVAIDDFDDQELLYFERLSYESASFSKSEIILNKGIVYLSASLEGLSEIVISASKFQQNKNDVPQRIVGISAKQVRIANPQTSADLLDNSGRVFIQKSQMGGGSPMIRGFSTNRLLITIDGVRMNNAIFRGGNLQNVISIDPFAVHHTEVTLGAGSVVYGSDAIGGVMSFYTKKPQLSYKDSLYFSGESTMRYASANSEKTGHFNINFGLKKWGFLTALTHTDFDDLRMGSHGPQEYLRLRRVVRQNGTDIIVANNNPKLQNPTGYSQINMMQKVHYEPSDYLKFDLGLYFTTTSQYPRYDRLLRPNGDVFRSAEWNYGPQQWFMGNFQMTSSKTTSFFYNKLQSGIAYQNFKESRIQRDFQSELREHRAEQVDALSFNLDLEKTLSDHTTLYYGTEYVYNNVNSESREQNINTNTNAANVTRYPDGATWQSLAVYSSFKFKPNKTFVFQSGLRYNHVFANANFTANNVFLNLPFNTTEISTGALTGSAGVSWSPNPMLQWRVNASTAFRAPNIDDIGKVFDSEPGAVVVPNNNLEAEYAYGGELGLKLNFKNTVIIDLATYYTFLNDALIRRTFEIEGQSQIIYDNTLSDVQAIQNASKAWIYGLEIGVEFNFSDQLKALSQYNIIGGSEENNGIEVPVRHVAPSFGRTHLKYNTTRFGFDAFLVYNNELSFNQLAPSEYSKEYLYAQDENGNPYSPSWYTLNFRSQYQVSEHLSVTATLENITDQRYRPFSSGIAAPGRNLILSATYKL